VPKLPSRIGQWQEVETALTADIAAGRLLPGEKLPTEPELCERFNVGRHSLRRALAALAGSGRLRIRQGSGTFVAEKAVLQYNIGTRTRFSQNLSDQGMIGSGSLLSADTVDVPAEVARALDLQPQSQVHCFKALGRADGVPISLGTAWHPAARFPDMVAQRRSGLSVTKVYAASGISDYLRRDTTFISRPALRAESVALEQSPDHPVIVTIKIDVDLDDRPIGYSEVVWSAERVQFTIGPNAL
tara:strand:+ start:26500 stop:27231 length:732 start_codon:yes stop_codon:yes gene_type:complete